MIVLFLVICIAMIITGATFVCKRFHADGGEWLFGLGAVFGFFILIIALIVGTNISGKSIANEKVKLYQAENAKIETAVNCIVENYKNYEQDTFEKIKGNDVVTLITLFPELKADKLVKKQIDIYNENKKKIIELKEEEINMKPLKWWLYFGS